MGLRRLQVAQSHCNLFAWSYGVYVACTHYSSVFEGSQRWETLQAIEDPFWGRCRTSGRFGRSLIRRKGLEDSRVLFLPRNILLTLHLLHHPIAAVRFREVDIYKQSVYAQSKFWAGDSQERVFSCDARYGSVLQIRQKFTTSFASCTW